MARSWLVEGLAKRWLWAQLGACALVLALCALDVVMVLGHVSCSVYRRTVQGVPGEVVAFTSYAVGAGGCLWRLAAQIGTRQYRAVAWSLGLVALEVALLFGAFTLDLDKTLFYCSFAGSSINACEMGLCAH